MTVEEAARSLGIKEESVRKHVRRGKLRSEKEEDGRLYVFVEATETVWDEDEPDYMYADQSVDESNGVARELIESKDEIIPILQDQLQQERAARRPADTIIVQLTQAKGALGSGLEAPPAKSAPPRRAPEGVRGAVEPENVPHFRFVVQETSTGHREPWWGRCFGK